MVTRLAQSSAFGVNFLATPFSSTVPVVLAFIVSAWIVPALPLLLEAVASCAKPAVLILNFTACLAAAMPIISFVPNLTPAAARLCKEDSEMSPPAAMRGAEAPSELNIGAAAALGPTVLTENKLNRKCNVYKQDRKGI